jgi:hypothetical protein
MIKPVNASKPEIFKKGDIVDYSPPPTSACPSLELHVKNFQIKLSANVDALLDGNVKPSQEMFCSTEIRSGEEELIATQTPTTDPNPWADTQPDICLDDLPIPLPPPEPKYTGLTNATGGLWR